MNIRKVPLFNSVNYSVVDYESAADLIIAHARRKKSFGVSALAVHGFVEAYNNSKLKEQINRIDLVVPDGQPVRWALNFFHQTELKDRVYGPLLTERVLERANDLSLGVYLYGSTGETLEKLTGYINRKFPRVKICGAHADRFREATPEEDARDVQKINASGAHLILVGRGCPRQEKWVADHLGSVNGAMMAVGAAFNFYAGNLKQSPRWMQDNGLEWFFRLTQEPRRLWKRYLFTNTQFIYLFLKQNLIKKPDAMKAVPVTGPAGTVRGASAEFIGEKFDPVRATAHSNLTNNDFAPGAKEIEGI